MPHDKIPRQSPPASSQDHRDSPASPTPTPLRAPTCFRQVCDHCGHEVVFTYNERLSAALDWVGVWEERRRNRPKRGRR